MKTFHKLVVIAMLSLIMSCDFGKNNSPDHSTTGRTVPENKEITNTTNYNKTGNLDAMNETSIDSDKVVDSLNENWNLDNPKRKANLYTKFEMSQEQIERYEKALQSWKESDKDDAYKIMSAKEKIKAEDRILKDILNDSQYKNYKEWSKVNDQRP